MRMDDIGYHHTHGGNFCIDRPHGAGDYLLLLIKTPALFRIEGADVIAAGGAFILFTPDYPQYYRAVGEKYIDDWMHFGMDDDELSLLSSLSIPQNRVISLAEIAPVSAILSSMCYEHYSAHSHRREVVNLYFRLLLYKLHEQMSQSDAFIPKEDSPYAGQLIWIRENIYRHPEYAWDIERMADKVGVSRSRLQHLYAQVFHCSISHDIIQSRVDKMAMLAVGTDDSIETIATKCGYSDSNYARRQFQRVRGETLSDYRQKRRARGSRGAKSD